MKKRVFFIVLDSVGVGYAPDAEKFGDVGASTFGTCQKSGLLNTPNLKKLGIYNIEGTNFYDPIEKPVGAFCKLQEQSAGKDTTVGHWEMAGLISEREFPTYPNGFPQEITDRLEKETGRGILCNKPYSGTEVIKDYGREQKESGKWIVYTSADSVLQIASHEDVIPLEELYSACKIARNIMQGEHGVGRIIARPYIGEYPNYERTLNRHDFSLEPPKETLLDACKKAGLDSIGIGKIGDIFAHRGLTQSFGNKGNTENLNVLLDISKQDFSGLCYVNLVDFDSIYGHRRDITGYTDALNEADTALGKLMDEMQPDDLLVVTADHGCDPAYKGTDHTREYVPGLIYKKGMVAKNLHTRSTYADLAATIAEYLGVKLVCDGKSFLGEIL